MKTPPPSMQPVSIAIQQGHEDLAVIERDLHDNGAEYAEIIYTVRQWKNGTQPEEWNWRSRRRAQKFKGMRG